MTLPRPVIPGRSYLITRRCSERRFFLRPDIATNDNFLYCLAYAAEQSNIQVTFALAMSNHYHAGIFDPDGNFPVFLEKFHSLLGRSQNAHLGRFEAFWSNEATSVVWLVNPEDALDKLVYTFTNPAAADLVATIHDWPGAHTFSETLSGGTLTIKRPQHFFREEGEMPMVATLPIRRLVGFENFSAREWRHLIKSRVRDGEASHRDRRHAEGKGVLGREKILRQSPFACPTTRAPRFKLSPRIAAKSKWLRIEALQRNQAFVAKHAEVVKLVRDAIDKIADVLFPFGTYRWRKHFGCRCEPDPTDSFVPFPVFVCV